jgi:methionyl-tRNA formyltransferase
MSLMPPPVKAFALERGLPVFQPDKLRDGAALSLLRELNPELIVVVAYGRILPPDILALPQLGCVNAHASLLPRLRGAAPIQWSVINGDKETGVTTMYMAGELDAGDIILKRSLPILEEDDSGSLFEKLAPLGAELLGETISLIEKGNAPRAPQEEGSVTFAPPITKETARLSFLAEPESFCNLVRGLCPSPGAVASLAGEPLKIYRAAPVPGIKGEPGELLDPSRLTVGCGEGAVELLEVQPQGKKRMEGRAWLNGRRDIAGKRFM